MWMAQSAARNFLRNYRVGLAEVPYSSAASTSIVCSGNPRLRSIPDRSSKSGHAKHIASKSSTLSTSGLTTDTPYARYTNPGVEPQPGKRDYCAVAHRFLQERCESGRQGRAGVEWSQ